MSNWYYNIVEFIAETIKLIELQALFLKLAKHQTETWHAQCPAFIAEPVNYFFDTTGIYLRGNNGILKRKY